jgi:hypothetical protein
MEAKKPLNQRKWDRYFIDEIPIEGIGSIVEVSRKGLKIRKAPGFTVKPPTLNFNLSTLEIKTEIRWEDKNFIGLQFSGAFNDPAFIIKRIKKPKEIVVPPQMSVSDKSIQQYRKDEILTKMVNLLMEVDSPEPNIWKIGTFINEISNLQEKENKTAQEVKAGEEIKNGDQKKNGEEGKGEGGTVKEIKENEYLLKDELIARAISSNAGGETRVADVNFAINRLGLDNIREILRNYVHKRFFKSENSLSVFQDCEAYNILKSAVFKNLCRLFGFSDIQPEGNALLACEIVGVEILIKESSGILDNYYKSTSRLYSEVSLMYEKALFGVDPIQINKYYFEKGMGAFEELYSGYVLSHVILNPHYRPSEKIRISLTKNGLIFSYIAYLTFLAVKFIMDRDKESGFVLVKRLKGKGMDDKKIMDFLDKSVSESKTILKDFAVKGSIARPTLPAGSLTIENYFGKNRRFEYLLRTFRNFSSMNLKRMALRYEDASYAHFILGNILNFEGLGLNSKTFIVVPCKNVSDDPWYVRDFSYFDLLIFKDINKLPAFLMSTFLKLWNSFEGQIIVTFSNLEFLDYTNPQLYAVLNSCLVDFPSYYLNDSVYRKMIEHCVYYLKPYIGQEQVDMERYLNEVYTMNHIKTDILLNKEIV